MSTHSSDAPEFAEQKAKDLAISGMAVSIALLLMCCGVPSFIGALMGHRALGQLNALGNRSHRGFAIAAISIGWAGTGLALIALFIAAVVFGVAALGL